MKAVSDRFHYLFRSTKGLILVAIALIAIVTAMWGMLSGPLREWGISDAAIRLYGMRLVEAEREGRIILLYHTIAMAVVAIEVYLITALVPMKPQQQASINVTITVGYVVAMIFGLAFGYFGHNFVFHGLFIFGQSLVFFAGLMLVAALWPWRKEYHVKDPDYAHSRGGVDLERVAFFTMAAATLGSALFGAVPGSLWGRGQETFLAEDIVRIPFKTPLQLAVIGHLHIMLALNLLVSTTAGCIMASKRKTRAALMVCTIWPATSGNGSAISTKAVTTVTCAAEARTTTSMTCAFGRAIAPAPTTIARAWASGVRGDFQWMIPV